MKTAIFIALGTLLLNSAAHAQFALDGGTNGLAYGTITGHQMELSDWKKEQAIKGFQGRIEDLEDQARRQRTRDKLHAYDRGYGSNNW